MVARRRAAVAVAVGVRAGGPDLFPEQTISGHDASYSSNGQTVNARGTYGWRDADEAINQPWLVPSLLVGVTWRP